MRHPQSPAPSIAERIAVLWWDGPLQREYPELSSWHALSDEDRQRAIAQVRELVEVIHAAGLAIVEAEDGR
jgi:hypothetical protein